MLTKYQDRFGILHNKIVIDGDPETSENGILYSAIYLLLQKMNSESLDQTICAGIKKCYNYEKDIWLPTPVSSLDSHLSHDNCTGIKLFQALTDCHLCPPIQRAHNNGIVIIHPRDAIVSSLIAGDWFKSSKLYILSKMSGIGKDPKDNSSSPQLWLAIYGLLWLRGIISNRYFLSIFFEKFASPKSYWVEVFFEYYLHDIDHPIVAYASATMAKK